MYIMSQNNANIMDEYDEELIIPTNADILEFIKIDIKLLQESSYIKDRFNDIINILINSDNISAY